MHMSERVRSIIRDLIDVANRRSGAYFLEKEKQKLLHTNSCSVRGGARLAAVEARLTLCFWRGCVRWRAASHSPFFLDDDVLE